MTEHQIALVGDYDHSRKDELAAILGASEFVDGDTIVIDIAGVPYVDSTALNQLARLRRRLPNSRIVIAQARGPVKRILEIGSFGAAFELRDE